MATDRERKVRAAMKALGVYRSQFDPMIEVYCQLRDEYDELTRRYKESEYAYAEATDTGSKKAPIVTTLESLRKDLLAYAAQLGLTAAGLKKLKDDAMAGSKKKSALETALEQFGGERSQ